MSEIPKLPQRLLHDDGKFNLYYLNEIYKTLDVLNRKDKEHYVLIDVEGSKEKLKWIKSKLREKT